MIVYNRRRLRTYLFWALIIGLLALTAILVRPFVVAIVSAYILAYMARPVHVVLEKRLPVWAASLISTALVIVLILIPLAVIGTALINQATVALTDTDITNLLDGILNNGILQSLNVSPVDMRTEILGTARALLEGAIGTVPAVVTGLLITVLGLYYFLCDWDNLAKGLARYIPVKNKGRVIKELDGTTHTILFGTLVIALLEAIVAFAGFYLSGVEAYLLLATALFIFAFVPGFGPLTIWGPLAIFYLVSGRYDTMIGVTVTGLIISVGIESLLYTYWVGSKSRIHPFVMLLGVIGGITVFGVFGFLIGPLLLANTIRMLERAVEPG